MDKIDIANGVFDGDGAYIIVSILSCVASITIYVCLFAPQNAETPALLSPSFLVIMYVASFFLAKICIYLFKDDFTSSNLRSALAKSNIPVLNTAIPIYVLLCAAVGAIVWVFTSLTELEYNFYKKE